jgi:hypothetical protein
MLSRPEARSENFSASAEPSTFRLTSAAQLASAAQYSSPHPRLLLGPSPCDLTEEVGLPWRS